MMNLSNPVEIKLIHKRDNGTGVVGIPLLPATEIDLSRTAGGGKSKVKIDGAVLREIVANFSKFPGPVPIGIQPHTENRGGMALGFINAVSVKDGALYGEVDLTSDLFTEVMAGHWRGFSVEIGKDIKTATTELEGWALTGGVFTNRPATDVDFRIAASEGVKARLQKFIDGQWIDIPANLATHTTSLTAMEERTMAENESVAALEADVATQKELVSTLRAQCESMKLESGTLEAKLTESVKDCASSNIALAEAKARLSATEEDAAFLRKQITATEHDRRELQVKLEAEQTRALKDQVLELVHSAIDRGVSASLFEGVEEDPAKWFNVRYNSIEALTAFLTALPTVKDSATRSGSKDSDKKADLSSDDVRRLRRLGLDPKYSGIADEDDLRELKDKE